MNAREHIRPNTHKREHPAANTQRPEFSPSTNSLVDQILYLQRTIGNRAVRRLIESGVLQRKLRIGKSNDMYEQEADRVADQVMRPEGSALGVAMPDLKLQRQPEAEEEEAIQTKPQAGQITPLLQRQIEPEEEEEPVQAKLADGAVQQRQKAEPEEEEEEPIQTKANPGKTPTVTLSLTSRVNSLKGGGQPLPESVRAYFEPRFKTNFSHVRVHTDTRAAETTRRINAKTFTKGNDIVFETGQYSPEIQKGRRLLGHELVHVVQQKTNRLSTLMRMKKPCEDDLLIGVDSRGKLTVKPFKPIKRDATITICSKTKDPLDILFIQWAYFSPHSLTVRQGDCEEVKVNKPKNIPRIKTRVYIFNFVSNSTLTLDLTICQY